MSGTQATNVIKYAVLPGIIPRTKKLFASGFGFLAYLMAHIYATVRLLPANHPYLRIGNKGKYTIPQVMAAAANNLVISKKNIDQLLIFGIILLGIVLVLCQIGILLFSVLSGTAEAGIPGNFQSFFITPNPNNDVAFILLDQVFGVPPTPAGTHFFGSCIAQNIDCVLGTGIIPAGGGYPWPFHIALHQMFRFYSLAILVVGALIFLYFIVVVVAETATTGTPFGQRFQNVWVPIRLVVAIGLLVPLPASYGGTVTAAYNAGQYITFLSAYFGSSLATNAWRVYNNAVAAGVAASPGGGGAANPLGEGATLIGKPNPPSFSGAAEIMTYMHVCAYSHYLNDDRYTKVAPPNPRISNPINGIPIGSSTNPGVFMPNMEIKPYFVKAVENWHTNTNAVTPLDAGTDYETARDFYQGGNIRIRFGILDQNAQEVESTCGDIVISVFDKRAQNAGPGYLGSVEMQALYFDLIRDLWWDTNFARPMLEYAGNHTVKNENSVHSACIIGCGSGIQGLPCTDATLDCRTEEPTKVWQDRMIERIRGRITGPMDTVWLTYLRDGQDAAITNAILDGNWGNAGTWFPTIARINGAFTDAFVTLPRIERYPKVMEQVREKRRGTSPFLSSAEMFNPNAAGNQLNYEKIRMDNAVDEKMAVTLHKAYEYWNGDGQDSTLVSKIMTASSLKDIMNSILGTHGLYDMTTNNFVHPLAQLASLGKGLVESSIRNVALSTMGSGVGGLLKAVSPGSEKAAQAIAGFFSSTAFLGLSAGVVLFYIVPFLPFVYFFFAVGSWVKTIFEAMVGVPLWALSHLRLDGEGLPGEAAANGYFLIFEIFLRPILTVAGLIAAMTIFTSQAYILNAIWTGTVSNVGGFPDNGVIATLKVGKAGTLRQFHRSEVDQFFFTIIYAIVVYMAATASFKLVDTIPDNILRWAGQGVSSFGDINQDTAQGLQQYAALGGITAGRQVVEGTGKLAGGLGGSLGSAAARVTT